MHTGQEGVDDAGSALRLLPQAAHLAAPHELPALIRDHAHTLGARDAVAHLVDLKQTVLLPFVDAAADHDPTPLGIDGTLAGRAYQHVEILPQDLDGDTLRDALDPRTAGMLNGTAR